VDDDGGAGGRHAGGRRGAGHHAGVLPAALPRAVPLGNLWLAMAKSVVFGVLIALIGCHFGLKVKPNTESLGRAPRRRS
jgi:phospholipid/cholesterol/gamma-HCH transport system permease protein